MITIHGDIGNSEKLWNEISPYGVNLTQLLDKTFVYGDSIDEHIIAMVLYHCAKINFPITYEGV